MQDWLSMQVIGINIPDQTTGEMFGQKILYTIQMILLDTVVTYRCLTGHRSARKQLDKPAYTTGATGTNAAFFVWRVGTTYYVNITNAGTGYANLNTFSIVGTALGGDPGTHDALITVNTVDGAGAIQSSSITGTANSVSDGLEANTDQWELVLTGISYVGDYARGTRYKPK